jgi:hypothetical protein
MEFNNEINWTPYLENYFKQLGEKSFGYAWLHKKSEARYSKKRNYIDLPVIVLSTIAGTLSIGTSSIFGVEYEKEASIGIGLLSIMVSTLNTIGTYFSFSSRTEAHRIAHIQYGRLYRFLDIELSLPRNERMLPKDLLKVSRDTYERLHEISPLIPNDITSKFSKKFKTYDVAKPSEANGLEAIVIFKENKIENKEDEEREDSLPKSDSIDSFLNKEYDDEAKININI